MVARRTHLLLLFTATLAVAGLIIASPGKGNAAETFYFLTLKAGEMTAENSGDTLFDRLEEESGELQGDRKVSTLGIEFDLYTAPSPIFAIGLGLETHEYSKSFSFVDFSGALPSERISIEGRTLLYTLKAYLRFGAFLPFVGVGSGNYYVKYKEKIGGASFIDAAPEVWTARVGLRMLVGRLGLLLEYGQIRAPLKIRSRSDGATLELGGTYTAVGLSVSF